MTLFDNHEIPLMKGFQIVIIRRRNREKKSSCSSSSYCKELLFFSVSKLSSQSEDLAQYCLLTPISSHLVLRRIKLSLLNMLYNKDRNLVAFKSGPNRRHKNQLYQG